MNFDDGDDEVPDLRNLDDDRPDEVDAAVVADGAAGPSSTTRPPDDPLPPVPVTILTGFLGSGKTTLVRNILSSREHGRRIAVIENEFGGGEDDDDDVDGAEGGGRSLADRLGFSDPSSLSVESMIARDGSDGSNLVDLIELPNGCVCCTVKDSLVSALENLLEKRSDLDYVIVEASGMADPGPVASVFWLDEALESRLRLDGVVACVDAKNLGFQLESTSSTMPSVRGHKGEGEGGDEAARQIAFADRIVVNKVDLLRKEGVERGAEDDAEDGDGTTTTNAADAVLSEIRSINPTAPIRVTTYSRIDDLDWILDARCFDAQRARDVEFAFRSATAASDFPGDFASGFRCADPLCASDHASNGGKLCAPCAAPPPERHWHTGAVGTVALFRWGSVDLRKLNAWLATILWPDQDERDAVLRARLEGTEDVDGGARREKDARGNSPSEGRKRGKVGKPTIFRMKGILSVLHGLDAEGRLVANDWVDDGRAEGLIREYGLDRRRYVLQGVHDLWDVEPASQNLCWKEAEARCCKVIVIGRWLDEAGLEEGFRDCFRS
ncbi:hypothetical protein ACHAWF_009404 [Thalassiosira exigua]